MLGLERERLGEVPLEVVPGLAGNPVQEVEREVVEAHLTEVGGRATHVVGSRPPLENVEEVRLEALRPERDPRHAVAAEECGDLGSDRLGVGLDGDLLRFGKGREQPRELRGDA